MFTLDTAAGTSFTDVQRATRVRSEHAIHVSDKSWSRAWIESNLNVPVCKFDSSDPKTGARSVFFASIFQINRGSRSMIDSNFVAGFFRRIRAPFDASSNCRKRDETDLAMTKCRARSTLPRDFPAAIKSLMKRDRGSRSLSPLRDDTTLGCRVAKQMRCAFNVAPMALEAPRRFCRRSFLVHLASMRFVLKEHSAHFGALRKENRRSIAAY